MLRGGHPGSCWMRGLFTFHNPLQQYLFNLRPLSSEFLRGCLPHYPGMKSPSVLGYAPVSQSCRPSLIRLSEIAVLIAGKCTFEMKRSPSITFLTAQSGLFERFMSLSFLNRVIFRAVDPFDFVVSRKNRRTKTSVFSYG